MEKRVVLLGLALIFLGFYAKGLEISGSCSSTSVQCDLQINEIEVFNDSGTTQTFFPHTSGEVSDWMRVLPESLTLEPGESGIFEVYTIATCYAEPGYYTAQVTISNDESESLFCDIEIEQGHFVDIDLEPSTRTVTQCKQAEYTIVLENETIVPNQEKELVRLSVTGLPREWVTLETTELIVEKGQEEEVELTILAPCDTPLGEYGFEVKASLFNPNFFSSKWGEFRIEEGQDLRINPVDGRYSNFVEPFLACSEEKLSYVIELSNRGEQPDTLELELVNAPAWVELSESNVSLDAGEEKEIEIILRETDAPTQLYNLELRVSSTEFDFEKRVDFIIDLKDCYNLIVEKLFGEQNVCNEEELIYKFELFNDREKTIDLTAVVEGLEGEVTPSEFSIGPQEKEELEVRFDVSGIGEGGRVLEREVAVEIIMDASGSMDLEIEGEKKIEIAKDAIISFVNNISEVNLALRVFGHNEGCADSTLLVPLSRLNVSNTESKIEGFSAIGDTPLSETLQRATDDFVAGKENYIILVSDGKESCEGNIESAIEAALNKGITVYAIGFDIDESGRKQLENIAEKTSGKYFDATNSYELVNVFDTITRELEIQLPKESENTFTLKLESQNFYFEKDFTVNINDCYNISLSTPNVSVCRAVDSQNSFTITNLGTKEQTLSIITDPLWAESDGTVTLNSGEEKVIAIALNPLRESTEEELVVTVKSDNTNVFDTGVISYLDEQTCYGFGLEVEAEFEGRIGEGERRKILFSNHGQTPMFIAVESDEPWVYFEPEQVQVEKGKTGFVNFYITPPFDFMGQTKNVLLTARNEFGFEQQKELTLIVTGPGFGLIPANISVTMPTTQTQPENGKKTVIVEFELKNESDQTLEIYSIETDSVEAQFEVETTTLKESESTKVTMTASVPADFEPEMVTAELQIKTSEGVFNRTLEFEFFTPRQVVKEKEEPPSAPTGLFSLANAQLMVVGVLVLIVVGLLLYSVVSAAKPEKKEPKVRILQKRTVKKPAKAKKRAKKPKAKAKKKK